MITAEQREARKSVIGSSDVPALCGVDPWRNIHDLWLEKTGQLEDRPASDDCDRGIDLEPAVLDMFERRMNVKLERNIELRNGGIFGANLDGAILRMTFPGDRNPFAAIVEAKTTTDGDEWGDGLEDVPLRVFVQVQEQMMVADCRIAYIPVLIPKFRKFHFEIYQVQRHDGLIAQIKDRGEIFWERYVLRDIPPPEVMPHLEALKRIRREPASKIALDGGALAAWTLIQDLKATRKVIDESIEATYSQILAMLGQAEAGELEDGSMLTYLEQNGSYSCDWQLLEMRLRECGQEVIYNELVRQSRFRVLRHKKGAR